MPEYPEIYTYIKDLSFLEGLKLIKISSPSSNKRFEEFKISGYVINNIYQEGKRINIVLSKGDNKKILQIHLGMTGRLTLSPHERILRSKITLNDRVLYLYDDRGFGYLRILPFSSYNPPDIFSDVFRLNFTETLVRRDASIFTLLLDQNIALGVGSYMAQESLFYAGISPLRRNLVKRETLKIYKSLLRVTRNSINSSGASMRDYRRLDGSLGGFQGKFRVYGLEGNPCFKCKTLLLKIKIAGRGVTYCPSCQL